ncbi:MAG: DNA polymerase III subunit [Defluviitaleaceae bacterium]|nr:DNA polymerase III subunit [Defluviitaleaceae bacterium]
MFHVEREQGFAQIIGGELIKRAMAASVARGRVSHAYIICGGAGFGKSMFANAFAKAILCASPMDGQGCGTCTSCRTYDSGNNPDVIVVEPKKATLGVGEVREEIVAGLAVLPYSSTKRIYIIKDAHKMTPSAQNAMLLSLEDGPKHAVFLLLATNLEAFLPTILSRCITYKIAPLSTDTIRTHLTKKGIAPDIASFAADFANGGMGRALRLATDQDFMQLRQTTLALAKNAATMDIPQIFATAKELEQHKDNIADILDILKLHYKDKLITGDFDCLAKIQAIDNTKEKLTANCPFLLCMEMLLISLSK